MNSRALRAGRISPDKRPLVRRSRTQSPQETSSPVFHYALILRFDSVPMPLFERVIDGRVAR
jgi:hypothetical protein